MEGLCNLTEDLEARGIDVSVLESGKYFYSPFGNESPSGLGKRVDPFAIGESFLRDLLVVTEIIATSPRHKGLIDLARQIYAGDLPDEASFYKVLSKGRINYFNFLMEKFDKREGSMGGFNVFDKVKVRNPLVIRNKLPEGVLESELNVFTVYRDMVTSELIGILESKPEFRKVYEDFSVVWERYNPREYDLPHLDFQGINEVGLDHELEQVYEFSVERSLDRLTRAAKNIKSCLIEGDRVKDIIKYTDDPGTLTVLHSDSRGLEGYSRGYLMEDRTSQEPILAIDNIETCQKGCTNALLLNNDRFRAAGLALIQLGLDGNFGCVVAHDNRIRYGIKQGFGNKYTERGLRKLGNTDGTITSYYEYEPGSGFWNGKTSVLMVNWRRHVPGDILERN